MTTKAIYSSVACSLKLNCVDLRFSFLDGWPSGKYWALYLYIHPLISVDFKLWSTAADKISIDPCGACTHAETDVYSISLKIPWSAVAHSCSSTFLTRWNDSDTAVLRVCGLRLVVAKFWKNCTYRMPLRCPWLSKLAFQWLINFLSVSYIFLCFLYFLHKSWLWETGAEEHNRIYLACHLIIMPRQICFGILSRSI